jgi:type VI secretion system Hcp family effector
MLLGASAPAAAQSTSHIYLAIDQVPGTSQSAGHEDEINVLAVNWGIAYPVDTSTGSLTGGLVMSPLVVTKAVDAASPLLVEAAARNDTFQEVVLTFWQVDPSTRGSAEYFSFRLYDARIISVTHTSAIGEVNQEQVSLAYKTIELEEPNRGNMAVLVRTQR